jgi:cell division protein FtsW
MADEQRAANGGKAKNRRITGDDGRAARAERASRPIERTSKPSERASKAPAREPARKTTRDASEREASTRRENSRKAARESSANLRVSRREAEAAASRENQRRPSEVPPAPLPVVVGGCDPILTATVIAVLAFGLVMVYSASGVFAYQRWHDDLRFLIRQLAFSAVGLVAMAIAARTDYHKLRPFTYFGMALTLGLMVWIVFRGHAAGGAVRWLQFGSVHLQPAELAKLATIVWLAHSLAKKTDSIRSFSIGVLPHVIGAAVLFLLCMKQPDFGSAMMIALIVTTMLFTAGARLGYLLGVTALASPIVYWFVASGYRMKRILAFLSPNDFGDTLNYQLHQSQMSFGAGGVTGVGLGDSRQKLMFLPEAHTDFISAIVGEELGFVGFVVLVAAFLLIVYRGTRVALRASDEYGTYLASGITMFLGAQAFTNLAVAVGLFPTKGLVLPFISYGGTSLLVNCLAVGILLNVSRPRSTAAFRGGEHLAVPARALGGVA